MPTAPLGLINNIIFKNIQNSLAPRTWSSYSVAWSDWVKFCSNYFSDPLLPNLEVLLLYVSFLMSNNSSASHISKQLAGIGFFHKFHNVTPITNHFLIRQAIKGYRKNFPILDRRRPISFDILERLVAILPSICSSPFETKLFSAAFVLAFFAALRISEFVAPSKSTVSTLKLSDVFFAHDSLKNFISKSKMDQLGRGAWISLFPLSGSLVCPFKVMSDYFSIRPFHLGSFFIHQDRSVLTVYQFNAVLRRCLRALHLDGLNFTSHSFRIGAATEAARLGLDGDTIRRLGRWDSERFKVYIRPHLAVAL